MYTHYPQVRSPVREYGARLLSGPPAQQLLPTSEPGAAVWIRSWRIHSKSGKVCGVCFSVSQHLQKKCVNLNNNILRQRCVNHQISMNFVSKGHFCWGYTLFKCLNLRFMQWLNIIWGILQFYLWKQWNLDSCCIFSQSFCGNSKLFAESGHHGHPLLECMPLCLV